MAVVAAPTGGSCDLDPTLFQPPRDSTVTVSCQSYTDTNLPLTYSLHLDNATGEYQRLQLRLRLRFASEMARCRIEKGVVTQLAGGGRGQPFFGGGGVNLGG